MRIIFPCAPLHTQSIAEMQRVRALNAEVQVLELKRDMGNNILEMAYKQADWKNTACKMEQKA